MLCGKIIVSFETTHKIGMIFLALIALLLLRSDATFTHRAHLSDSLKLKCDALPYRTTYVDKNCYLADSEEVEYSDASAQCSTIFPGSKAAGSVPSEIFTALKIESSKFHTSAKSSGAKRTICIHENDYKCAEAKSTLISGKCAVRSDAKKTFSEAKTYCQKVGMELPAVGNDLENRILTGSLGKEPAWIQQSFDKTWTNNKNFARYGTCDRSKAKPPLYAGSQNNLWNCNVPIASVVDIAGYWSNVEQKIPMDVICIGSAKNDFVSVPEKVVEVKKVEKEPCVALHEWDEATERCEWTGPKDACLQLIHYNNRTWFMKMPNFPREVWLLGEIMEIADGFNDNAVKVIVRRGCMTTGYPAGAPERGDDPMHWYKEQILYRKGEMENLMYGEHVVPSVHNGILPGPAGEGLTRVDCYCDPAVATVNGHIPAPPRNKKCVKHHKFNEETQACEWELDSKYCGELITHDGRRMFMEIPDWPVNRKYDVMHKRKGNENFNVDVVDVIVRQHCFATLHSGNRMSSAKTLKTSGYGLHQVVSYHNGLTKDRNYGTDRVICECAGLPLPQLTDTEVKQREDELASKGMKEPCIAYHRWDEVTERCEWIGPKDACLQFVNYQNETWFFPMPNFPAEVYRHSSFPGNINDRTVKAIIRRGCMATGYHSPLGNIGMDENNEELVSYPIENIVYGEHRVPCGFTGDIPGWAGHGMTRAECFCDPSEATLNGHIPSPPQKKKCIKHHVFNETSQTCEWALERKYCGELITYDGRRMFIEIKNWPVKRKYDVMHKRTGNENFNLAITDIIVRQHCFATLYAGKQLSSAKTLKTSAYGQYQVVSYHNGLTKDPNYGTDRVQCECIQ